MYNLENLVKQVNDELSKDGLTNPVNERLVRHYTSSKIIPQAYKEGKEARYDDTHVESLVALRRSQSAGISAKAVKAMAASSPSGSDRDKALSFLRQLDTDTTTKTFNTSSLRGSLDSTRYGFCAKSLNALPTSMSLTAEEPVINTWKTIDVSDGVRLDVREDVYSSLDPQILTNVIDLFKRKTK